MIVEILLCEKQCILYIINLWACYFTSVTITYYYLLLIEYKSFSHLYWYLYFFNKKNWTEHTFINSKFSCFFGLTGTLFFFVLLLFFFYFRIYSFFVCFVFISPFHFVFVLFFFTKFLLVSVWEEFIWNVDPVELMNIIIDHDYYFFISSIITII